MKQTQTEVMRELVIKVLYLDSNFYWESDEQKAKFFKETANIARKVTIVKMPCWVDNDTRLKVRILSWIRRKLFSIALMI